MKSLGITRTRAYPAGNAGGAAASWRIAWLETSNSVAGEKSKISRQGGWDAMYLAVAAQNSNRIAPEMRPWTVARRILFFASKSTTIANRSPRGNIVSAV